MIDTQAIERHIRGILVALGDDPDREGLAETPSRVAKMYAEVFDGMNYTNAEIAALFDKTFQDEVGGSDIVLVKDIDISSYCEHHLALMYNMTAAVAYIPNGKVVGLSKIARVCDMAARRLQLQERLGCDIAEIMALLTGSQDIAVILKANHSCMTTRGTKRANAQTVTKTLRGRFETDPTAQNQLLLLLADNG